MRIFAILVLFSFCAFAKTQVFLADSSVVVGETITLGQIAEIFGEYKKSLDTMVVGTAAPAGFSRFLLKSSIILPAEMKNAVEIKGSDRIKIYSLAQKITFEDLAEKATELLADSLINNEYMKSEIMFEFAKGSEINIPLGDYEIVLGKIEKKQLRGRAIIPLVVIQKDGEKKTRVSINATIKTVARVCVAAKDIARYEKFAPQYLEYKTVDISTLQGTPLYEMPKLDEYQVIGAIRTGTIITDRHISPKPVIEAGSPVKMTTGGSMVKVSVWGRARTGGCVGDIIVLENMESNKLVKGKIIQPGEVEIVRGGTI